MIEYEDIKTCHEDDLDEAIFEQREIVLEWTIDKYKHMSIVRLLMILEEERTRRNG